MDIFNEIDERVFTYLKVIFAIFIFSWGIHGFLFRAIDYFKVDYTEQTKKKVLWDIFKILSALIWLFYLALSALLR